MGFASCIMITCIALNILTKMTSFFNLGSCQAVVEIPYILAQSMV